MTTLETNTASATSVNAVWPVVFREVLEIGNPLSNVSITTLWTHRKSVARKFEPHEYAVIGNLYGFEGIAPMIRNVYANPNIRYILLWGNELSGSGEALVEFMNAGVDADGRTPSGKVQIEPEISVAAIDQFRAAVKLIDLRGESAEKLREVALSLPSLPPFGTPTLFPIHKTDEAAFAYPEASPSEWSGFRVSDHSVAATWLSVLHTILRFGHIKRTKYGNTNELREILNLSAVVTDEDSYDEYLPNYLQLTHERLDAYYPQVVSSLHPEGTSYSYGQRLRDYDGMDQIQVMIDRLKQNRNSKRMFATTWRVAVDTPDTGEDVPCLTQVNGAVQDDRFFFTAHFRSQDMFGAWPLNAFAVRRLQMLIAKEADIALGSTTIITHSAHIYAWDWPRVRAMLDEYQRVKKPAAELDPRGYVVITAADGQIEARLLGYDNTVIDRLTGKSARQIGLEIVRRAWTADAGHALYLGGELEKAEIALGAGATYIQDAPLNL